MTDRLPPRSFDDRMTSGAGAERRHGVELPYAEPIVGAEIEARFGPSFKEFPGETLEPGTQWEPFHFTGGDEVLRRITVRCSKNRYPGRALVVVETGRVAVLDTGLRDPGAGHNIPAVIGTKWSQETHRLMGPGESIPVGQEAVGQYVYTKCIETDPKDRKRLSVRLRRRTK